MLEMDIKYPVSDSFPPDEQVSMVDLRAQGFREDTGAVVMRSESDRNVIYLLISDPVRGRSWKPLRLEDE